MTFWVSLIKTKSDHQFLQHNCTHVTGEYWLYEGDLECLDDVTIDYEHLGEGIVSSLGGLSGPQLVEICKDVFDVDVAT